MPANEASFKKLVDVPVNYDRLPAPFGYGSKGKNRTFSCRHKLKITLEKCFKELFELWGRDKPSIILTAGTIGDGANAHGQGFAFDLDGFYWGEQKFMMINYPADREFYLGINAHLFLHFSQVLSYHYPNHQDHFHVDFNFAFKFRPEFERPNLLSPSLPQIHFWSGAWKHRHRKGRRRRRIWRRYRSRSEKSSPRRGAARNHHYGGRVAKISAPHP